MLLRGKGLASGCAAAGTRHRGLSRCPSSRARQTPRPSAVLVVAAMCLFGVACTTSHVRVESPPDAASECLAQARIGDVDLYMTEVAAALGRLGVRGVTRRYLADAFAYERRGVAEGTVAFDGELAEATLQQLQTGDPLGVDFSVPFSRRCAASEFATCGANVDCPTSQFCDRPPGGSPCGHRGVCRARLAVGQLCADAEACEPGGTSAPVRCLNLRGDVRLVCASVVVHRLEMGARCDLPGDFPTRDSPTASVYICAWPADCVAGICSPRNSAGPDGACESDGNCAEGLYCNLAARECRNLDEFSCGPASGGAACPRAVAVAVACHDGQCVLTDGARGSRCDSLSFEADCDIGLACGDDGICGDPLPDGASCASAAPDASSECTSGCCTPAGGGVCRPVAP